VDYTAWLAKVGIKYEYFTNQAAKFKGAGAPGTSLTQDQRTNLQAQIESAFTMFKDTVNSNRPQVGMESMQGQTYRGSDAVSNGLVDAVGGESAALALLNRMIGGGRTR